MSIYVSIVLLSALTIFDDAHPPDEGEVLLLEVGTTLGLVLAHGFASWLSTSIVGESGEEVDAWDLLRVQLGGAFAVAVIVGAGSDHRAHLDRALCGSLHGGRRDRRVVFLESRNSNSWLRATVYGLLRAGCGFDGRRRQGIALSLARGQDQPSWSSSNNGCPASGRCVATSVSGCGPISSPASCSRRSSCPRAWRTRSCAGPAAGHRPVHDGRVPRRLRGVRSVPRARARTRLVDLAADLRRDRPARWRWTTRRRRSHSPGCWPCSSGSSRSARPRQARLRRRPPLERGAGRVHERARHHHHRRASSRSSSASRPTPTASSTRSSSSSPTSTRRTRRPLVVGAGRARGAARPAPRRCLGSPPILVAVVGVTIVSAVLDLADEGVATVGSLPRGVPDAVVPVDEHRRRRTTAASPRSASRSSRSPTPSPPRRASRPAAATRSTRIRR